MGWPAIAIHDCTSSNRWRGTNDLGIGLSVWLLPVTEAAAVPRWTGYLPLSLVVVGLALAAFAYLNWVRLLYVITDEEIYVKYGLISRDVTQIRLDRVQNTAYNQ